MKNTNKLAFRGGSYSLVITAIVLAILVVINVCVNALPSSATNFDISSSKLYSITSNTKAVVNNLNQDVTIYWIVQSDKEDSVIENLLSKYDSLSDHITVVKKNPDVYPTFTQQYTDDTLKNNSLIVESGDRYRVIPYDNIYITDADMYSYSYSTSFDGEGAITSAINYVISDDLPQVYTLEGHGESDLPSDFSDAVEKENIEVNSLSLLTVDSVPEDASCVIIYAPQSDISDKEAEMLSSYTSDGGKLLVMAGPVENESFENLYSILSSYGVSVNEGIVIESDRDHYAFGYPYVLIPDMTSNDITASLIEESYSPIFPISSGLTVKDSSNVESFLTTSEDSFSKLAGFSLETYEKEDGDLDGPFTVGLTVDTDNDGEIIWISCSDFLKDMYNAYSSGANSDLAMNALSSLVGQGETLAIRSKSLNYNYLTITDSQGAVLKAVMIGIIPVVYLAIGIIVFVHTRRKQNEEI